MTEYWVLYAMCIGLGIWNWVLHALVRGVQKELRELDSLRDKAWNLERREHQKSLLIERLYTDLGYRWQIKEEGWVKE